MPKRTRDGYVFFEDHHYLQKIGTREFYIYSKELAARDDMVVYNPFASDNKEIKKEPGVDEVEHRSNLTKEFTGYSREEIREITKEMNRSQRMLWAIDILFQKLPIHDLTQFAPSRVDIIKIIGPPVSGSDLIHAIETYKSNPTNLKALLADAAIAPPPEPEEFVLIKEPEPDDPITTSDVGSQ